MKDRFVVQIVFSPIIQCLFPRANFRAGHEFVAQFSRAPAYGAQSVHNSSKRSSKSTSTAFPNEMIDSSPIAFAIKIKSNPEITNQYQIGNQSSSINEYVPNDI